MAWAASAHRGLSCDSKRCYCLQTTSLDPSVTLPSPPDVPAAPPIETAHLGVQSAKSLDVTEPFGTVGKAAQLLGETQHLLTDQHQQAGAADLHLIGYLLTTAEAALTTAGTALLPQPAAVAEPSFAHRVVLLCVTGRILVLGLEQEATMMVLPSSQLRHVACLLQAGSRQKRCVVTRILTLHVMQFRSPCSTWAHTVACFITQATFMQPNQQIIRTAKVMLQLCARKR